MWQALSDKAGDDDALRLGYSPHITLSVLPDSAPVDALANAIRAIAKHGPPLRITLPGFGLFPGTPPVIWAAPVVTQPLLQLHASLHEAVAPFHVHPHYHPDAWVPHVTLTKSGQSTAARAIEIVTAAWNGPITATLARIDLVRFRPVQLLHTESFAA
jgi:2'-5' RNA ligase